MIANRYIRVAEGDDVEALQTDIMRFMAILGFCLMVIFAMVQSLPNVEVQQEPQLISKELLEKQIENLESKAKEIEQKLQKLDSTLSDKQQQVMQIEEAINASKQNLQETKEKLQKELIDLTVARQNINRQERDIAKLNRQTARLEELKQRAIDKIRNPEPTVSEPSKPVQTPQQTAEAPQQPKVDVEQSKPQPTPSEEKEQEKGLSLRFSSDQALMSLIQQNTIKFYVVKNKQYFRVLANGKVKVESINAQFYQMSAYTVPMSFKNRIKQHFTLTRSAKFGVTLPSNIEQQLYQFVNKHKSGELIIDANGKVNFQK